MNKMQTLLVAGTFNTDGGRPSGYIAKLAATLQQYLPNLRIINGGTHTDLRSITMQLADVQNLLWFADVPNEWAKLLPSIVRSYPKIVLVQSKNNRQGKYSVDDLYRRMHQSGAELLVEFTEDSTTRLAASVHTVSHINKLMKSLDIEILARCLFDELTRIDNLPHPLDCYKHLVPVGGYTNIVPTGQHVGAFGVERKHHIHEGVDLYGDKGQSVFAIEDGIIVGIHPFTGEHVGSPWWNDTSCVMIEGDSGVINYGELDVYNHLSVGQEVAVGEYIGKLQSVLKKDKGRPMTMLHLERYVRGTTVPIKEWTLGTPQPKELINPTTLLKY